MFFLHFFKSLNLILCSKWSALGCQIVQRSRLETICECKHLTAFAILMDMHEYVGKIPGLELLTLILCPASEVALLLTMTILFSANSTGLQKTRATISRNLSFCLFLGNGLVLFVLDRSYFHMTQVYSIDKDIF